MQRNVCRLKRPLPLQYGGALPELVIRWEQWGDPTLPASRTVFVMPSFSHSSHVCSSAEDPSPGWWEGFVGPGMAIDTNHFRVLSASVLGSPFGSTSPLSPVPEGGVPEDMLPEFTIGGASAPPVSLRQAQATGPNGQGISHYGPRFPVITPADQARCHSYLLDHLGLGRLHAVVGGSMGGMQALQFAALFPDRVARVVAISCTGRTTPSTVSFRRIQRQAIMTDPLFMGGFYHPKREPHRGMKLARELGMLSYRSREEFDARFDWGVNGPVSADAPTFEVEQYLDYQGRKFTGRYDANCYLTLSKSMDLMDLSDEQGRFVEGALRITADTLLLAVRQDMLTPARELEALHRCLAGAQAEEEEALAERGRELQGEGEGEGEAEGEVEGEGGEVAAALGAGAGAGEADEEDVPPAPPSTALWGSAPGSAARSRAFAVAAATALVGSGPAWAEGAEGAGRDEVEGGPFVLQPPLPHVHVREVEAGTGAPAAQRHGGEDECGPVAPEAAWTGGRAVAEVDVHALAGKVTEHRSEFHELDSLFGHDAMFHHECFPLFGGHVKRHLEKGLERVLARERVHTTGLNLP